MKSDSCPHGPFELEMKVSITNGKEIGSIAYTLPTGAVPTDALIKEALAVCVKKAGEYGYRLMDRHEFIADQLSLGGIAVPGPKTFNL